MFEEVSRVAREDLTEYVDCCGIDSSGLVVIDSGDGVGLQTRHSGDFGNPVGSVRPFFGHQDVQSELYHIGFLYFWRYGW